MIFTHTLYSVQVKKVVSGDQFSLGHSQETPSEYTCREVYPRPCLQVSS